MERALWKLAILVASIGAPLAQADITYTYTGNPFTTVTGGYTTAEFIMGSFTLTSALGSNVATVLTPNTFSFTDHHQTFTDTTPSLQQYFYISTDSAGNIARWDIVFRTNNAVHPFDYLATFNDAFATSDQGVHAATATSSLGDASGTVGRSAGRWASGEVIATPVPEPATVGLLMLVVLVTGFMARKRMAEGRRAANGTAR